MIRFRYYLLLLQLTSYHYRIRPRLLRDTQTSWNQYER